MLFIGASIYGTHWGYLSICVGPVCSRTVVVVGSTTFSFFRRLQGQFRKYIAGVMMCLALLRSTMRDSSMSVFLFVKYRDALMSCTQDVSSYLTINTRRERVWMSQHIQIFHLAI